MKQAEKSRHLESLERYVENLGGASLDAIDLASRLKSLYISFIESNPGNLGVTELKLIVNSFANIDELYFKNVLSRVISEEEHSLLISAIGNFGQYLSNLFQSYSQDLGNYRSRSISNVLFVIKGPFSLAHMSFVKSFTLGWLSCKDRHIDLRFVFLDDKIPSEIKHLSHDLTRFTTFGKMLSLKKIISQYCIGTIIWPSVAQHVSLYLGSRFTDQQILWSARYRNHLFDSIDKYFFGARQVPQSINYNGCEWRYGKFYVAEWKDMNVINTETVVDSLKDSQLMQFLERKKSQGFVLAATISTGRKMKSRAFQELILSLIINLPNLYYFYTSHDEGCALEKLLRSNGFSNRFKRIIWIDAMSPVLKKFDLILDSFPVGASHALCYALQSNTPFISLVTEQNLKSSLLETVIPTAAEKKLDLTKLGFLSSNTQYFEYAQALLHKSNDGLRSSLLERQKNCITSLLNNKSGMYSDFESHILS
ncbi:hypothetical protein [Prochlorococcus marinus]|uniref:hypothetical protein n=1 Tax=Prochlorococcus marinus TaxID=1219 RepID=UPI0007B3C1C3|nr:hypothetical protein [Prochlorococcus marinus]KZR73691.1 hypothetical protein PMIT1320_02286 [Prochlorococcus marinus str. MIT 1320]